MPKERLLGKSYQRN